MASHSVVDLFCGCGGMSAGFEAEGFKTILGADVNAIALKTFARNFPRANALNADLHQFTPQRLLETLDLAPGDLDCLIGGPPCQGFSKNVPARYRYLEDPRNQLILTFLSFVEVLQPKVLLIENVAEMMSAYEESYTSEILDALSTLGYKAANERLLSADYGVPQLRRRTFFFANRLGFDVAIPQPTHLSPRREPGLFNWNHRDTHVTVWDALSDLPSLNAGEGESPIPYPSEPTTAYQKAIRKGSKLLYDHVARPLTGPQLERVSHLEPGKGEGVAALPKRLRPRSGYSGAYARLHPEDLARTITRWVFHPGSGRYYHPFDNRVITIREAARLQSFFDRFVFEGTYIQKAHQVGEAVPPMVAQAFARTAKKMLLGKSQTNLVNKVS